MKSKKKKEDGVRFSSNGIISDIGSMRTYALNFLDKGKEYDHLLNYLLKGDFYKDDYQERPKIQDIIKELGLSYSKFKRQLGLIYEDITSDCETPFEFKEVEYCLGLSHYNYRLGEKKYKAMTIKALPFIPRVGETIEIPFFHELLDTTYFYVDQIYHEFFDTKLRIYLSLKGGHYNSWWQLRKDEAEAKGELPLMDFHNLDDWELKRKLGVRKH
jgi:hypothetical protein